MSLFSSKKVTTVGTSVSRVVSDDGIPNSVKTGVIKGIFENGDVSDYILEELMGSVSLKAERMFEYGKTHYTYGLPSGAVYSATQGTAEVAVVLAALEGGLVLLDYARFGPINNYHLAWMRLVESHGYNPTTNELTLLSAQKGKPVYVQSLQVVLPPAVHAELEAAALEQWGTSATAGFTPERLTQTSEMGALRTMLPVVVDPAAIEAHVRVTAVWEEKTFSPGFLFPIAASRYPTETFTHPLTGYDEDSDYFHVKYVYAGVTKYWLYEVGTGIHPTLDAVFDDPPDVAGTFFPFAYFRFGKVSMETLAGTPAYTTSRKLVKYLGINYADMIDAIHANPDIEDVEQAMLMLAVPAVTSNPLEQRYLFDFFGEQFFLQNPPQESELSAQIRSLFIKTRDASRTTTIIQDARFKMTLGNEGIFKKLVAGKLGKVGTHQSGYRTYGRDASYLDAETGGTVSYSILVKVHYYRRQVSASMYEELEVHGLRMTYHIYGKYNTVGDETDATLLIPLDRSITRTYSLPDREVLYTRALHYVFNSRVVTKVKWYQQEWFQFLLIIVAIVITIYTYGAAWEAMAAAISAGTMSLAAFAYMVAIGLMKFLLVQLAVKLFVKAVGVELAFLVAIIAAMAGVYHVIDAGSLAGAPWAEGLLQISTSITSGVQTAVQDAFADLAKDAASFSQYVEDQTKLLDTAQDLLQGNNLLSPFVVFGESPNDFYNRTVHSGNIGVVGISAISSFVDVALTLPALSETLGEYS